MRLDDVGWQYWLTFVAQKLMHLCTPVQHYVVQWEILMACNMKEPNYCTELFCENTHQAMHGNILQCIMMVKRALKQVKQVKWVC